MVIDKVLLEHQNAFVQGGQIFYATLIANKDIDFEKRKIQGGFRTKFWLGRWVGECSLKDAFPLLFRLASIRNAIVIDLQEAREMKANNHHFGRYLEDSKMGKVDQFMELIYTLRLQVAGEDSLLQRGLIRPIFKCDYFTTPYALRELGSLPC